MGRARARRRRSAPRRMKPPKLYSILEGLTVAGASAAGEPLRTSVGVYTAKWGERRRYAGSVGVW